MTRGTALTSLAEQADSGPPPSEPAGRPRGSRRRGGGADGPGGGDHGSSTARIRDQPPSPEYSTLHRGGTPDESSAFFIQAEGLRSRGAERRQPPVGDAQVGRSHGRRAGGSEDIQSVSRSQSSGKPVVTVKKSARKRQLEDGASGETRSADRDSSRGGRRASDRGGRRRSRYTTTAGATRATSIRAHLILI